jgi:large conductance mechanosensitive channel
MILTAKESACYGSAQPASPQKQQRGRPGFLRGSPSLRVVRSVICTLEGLAVRLFKGFKEFILRGNLVDLAVGFVVGAAFATLVKAFVADLITPLIGIFGKFSFPDWTFKINNSPFLIGDFINNLLSFLIISLVVFFFVVRPMAAILDEMKKHEKKAAPATRECPFCCNTIPIKATRCGFCTAEVAAVTAAAAAGAEVEKQ